MSRKVPYSSMVHEEQIPHAPDAERAVLGSILDSGRGCLARACQIIGEPDFYNPANRRIFRTMRDLDEKDAAVDPVTLREELRQRGELDLAGGDGYIGSLLSADSHSANLEHYAGIMRDMTARRARVAYALRELSEAALSRPLVQPNAPGDGDVPDADSLVRASGLNALSQDSPMWEIGMALSRLRELLKGADPLLRALTRESAIRSLSRARVKAPAALLEALHDDSQSQEGGLKGRSLTLADPEPWPEPVEGGDLADEICSAVERYVVMPELGAEAATLWTLHTHAHDAAAVSPILALRSPTQRCGKTRLLQVLEGLVLRSLSTANVSPAAVFRTIEAYRPTLLIDEGDSFLANKEELRGILNSGHTRTSATVIRTVGDNFEPHCFGTWGPKAIALIGELPSTLEDRAIVISMRRRTTGERVEPIRLDRLHRELGPLRRKAARWAKDNLEALRLADPQVPKELHDRACDNWRPLIAIADLLGGTWPAAGRRAAMALSGTRGEGETSSRVQLLADIRDIFQERAVDRLPSDDLVRALCDREDRPWREWKHGKPLSVVQLSTLLRRFQIKPKQLWIDAKKYRGYELGDFSDTFARYLAQEAVGPVEASRVNDLETPRSTVGENQLPPSGMAARGWGTRVLPGLPGEIARYWREQWGRLIPEAQDFEQTAGES